MVYAHLKKLEVVLIPLNILIRCDASIEIGLGHVTRCLVLAQQFKESGHHVFFAMKDYDLGIKKVKEQGFAVNIAPTSFNYTQWLLILAKELTINIFVGDVRDGLPVDAIIQLKKQNILTVAIDEPSDYRKACDLCFYPPHAQLDKLDWIGFNGEIKQGLEYVLLRPEFYRTTPSQKNSIKKVLVMMGGTDPKRLTMQIIENLKQYPEIKVHSIISASHPDKNLIEKSKTTIYFNILDMRVFLESFDYAIISFGMTAYELIALGIPSTHISLDNDHKVASEYFTKNKLANSLQIENINSKDIKNNKNIIDPTLSGRPYRIAKCQIVEKILKEMINAV